MSKDGLNLPENDLKNSLERIDARILALRKEIQELERKKTAIFTLLDVQPSMPVSSLRPPPIQFAPTPRPIDPSDPWRMSPPPPPPLQLKKTTREIILSFADAYYRELGPFTTGELAKAMQRSGYYLGDARPDIRIWSIVKEEYRRNKLSNKYEKK